MDFDFVLIYRLSVGVFVKVNLGISSLGNGNFATTDFTVKLISHWGFSSL